MSQQQLPMEPKPLPYAFVQRESGASLVAKAADLRRRRGLRAELMQQFKKMQPPPARYN